MLLIAPSAIPDVKIVEPKVFGDRRGYFMETWTAREFAAAGIPVTFVQDNESSSSRGVLRGLHFQAGDASQAKLVRVVHGAVFDVAVDIRRASPTFGQWVGEILTGENKRQLFIPRGFAHGFAVLSPEAVFAYKCDSLYCPAAERGMRLDDPALNIDWQLPREQWILSEKDMRLPLFKDITPWE